MTTDWIQSGRFQMSRWFDIRTFLQKKLQAFHTSLIVRLREEGLVQGLFRTLGPEIHTRYNIVLRVIPTDATVIL